MMLLTLLLVGSGISQGETDINVETAERRTATAQGGNGNLFLQLFRTVNSMAYFPLLLYVSPMEILMLISLLKPILTM